MEVKADEASVVVQPTPQKRALLQQIAQLKVQLKEKDDELDDMEKNLEVAVHSIKTFHEQQKKLYDEFVRLRMKYDRQKRRTRSLLWKYIPSHCEGFGMLPPVSDVTEDENRVDKYFLKEVIGQGQFAEVRKCVIGNNGSLSKNSKEYAIKIIDKFKITDIVAMRRIMNEILALRELQSDHIFGLLDLIQTKDYLYLVTECGGKDLFDYFEQHNGGLSEMETLAIFLKTATAVKHCHTSGFCHRDLKPENILLNTKTGRLHIIDFGLCARVGKHEQLSDFCGSPGFFAPEMITNGSYNGYQADLWSLGCILLELLLGHKQFEQLWMSAYDLHVLDDAQLFATQIRKTVHQTLTAFQESTLKEVKPISKECLEALQATLMLDPSRRATVNELLAMQWCTKDGHDAPTAVFSTQVPRRGRSKSHRDFAIQRTSPITAPQKSASLKPLKKATSSGMVLARPTSLYVGADISNNSNAIASSIISSGNNSAGGEVVLSPKGRRERKISGVGGVGTFDTPRFTLEVGRSGSMRLPPMRTNSPFASPLTPKVSSVTRLVHNSEDMFNKLKL